MEMKQVMFSPLAAHFLMSLTKNRDELEFTPTQIFPMWGRQVKLDQHLVLQTISSDLCLNLNTTWGNLVFVCMLLSWTGGVEGKQGLRQKDGIDAPGSLHADGCWRGNKWNGSHLNADTSDSSTMTMASGCWKVKYVNTHSQSHTHFWPIMFPLQYQKELYWLLESSML